MAIEKGLNFAGSVDRPTLAPKKSSRVGNLVKSFALGAAALVAPVTAQAQRLNEADTTAENTVGLDNFSGNGHVGHMISDDGREARVMGTPNGEIFVDVSCPPAEAGSYKLKVTDTGFKVNEAIRGDEPTLSRTGDDGKTRLKIVVPNTKRGEYPATLTCVGQGKTEGDDIEMTLVVVPTPGTANGNGSDTFIGSSDTFSRSAFGKNANFGVGLLLTAEDVERDGLKMGVGVRGHAQVNLSRAVDFGVGALLARQPDDAEALDGSIEVVNRFLMTVNGEMGLNVAPVRLAVGGGLTYMPETDTGANTYVPRMLEPVLTSSLAVRFGDRNKIQGEVGAYFQTNLDDDAPTVGGITLGIAK